MEEREPKAASEESNVETSLDKRFETAILQYNNPQNIKPTQNAFAIPEILTDKWEKLYLSTKEFNGCLFISIPYMTPSYSGRIASISYCIVRAAIEAKFELLSKPHHDTENIIKSDLTQQNAIYEVALFSNGQRLLKTYATSIKATLKHFNFDPELIIQDNVNVLQIGTFRFSFHNIRDTQIHGCCGDLNVFLTFQLDKSEIYEYKIWEKIVVPCLVSNKKIWTLFNHTPSHSPSEADTILLQKDGYIDPSQGSHIYTTHLKNLQTFIDANTTK